MGAPHSHPPPHAEQFHGYTAPTWGRWMTFIGYRPPRCATAKETIDELQNLKARNPDEWAAFVAAERILGRRIE